jgi:acyl-CoA synthetase (AMP-forming)/AMP-acid ligase II
VVKRRFTSDDWPLPPPEPTFVDLLRRRAAELPERTIYTELDDEFFDTAEIHGPTLTYSRLDERARAIAVVLRERAAHGDRVLLLFGPGLEFMPAFFGCLYAGVIPVPAYPPYQGLQADPLATLRAIARDCTPTAAMTGGFIAETVQHLGPTDPQLAGLEWINSDDVDSSRADVWRRPEIDADTFALLQYTSGSTGSPRGVVVSHSNLLQNEYILQLAFDHMTHVRPGGGVCWLPFHHDMGLMGSVLQSIFVDGPCYFMSPLQFLRKPVHWLQAITHLGPHTSGGPNFAYELCVRKITQEQKRRLDLSSWETAIVGAEVVSPSTIRRFQEAFEPCGFDPDAFYPCYGLAESTLFVTGGDFFAAPVIRKFHDKDGSFIATDPGDTTDSSIESTQKTLVGCGRPWLGHEVVIVDPVDLTECPPGTVGEIWVSGPSVAQGYWNKPQESEETFGATLPDDDRGPFLRTGDLGFLHEDELFITGRLKDVIVIRGRNYFPDDIEATVQPIHEAFRPGSTVAFGCECDGEERLIVLQEIDRARRRIDPRQLARAVRQRVAEEQQLQVYDVVFLKNGTLPKTTSGKIRRFAARQMYESGQLHLWKGTAR